MRITLAMPFIFLIPVLLLCGAILHFADGQFVYTLDDPYIHLALAKNIWLGNYGINLAEPSAPSSSIIWPFLLAPFAAIPSMFELVPLLINTACVLVSGYVLTLIFSELRRYVAIALAFF